MTIPRTPSFIGSTGQSAATWVPLAVIVCGTFAYVLERRR